MRTESLEQEFGLPPTYQYGVQSHAMLLEANYNIPIHPGIEGVGQDGWLGINGAAGIARSTDSADMP
jgi:hypothetical protein